MCEKKDKFGIHLSINKAKDRAVKDGTPYPPAERPAQIIRVIRTNLHLRGRGVPDNPYRRVIQFWTPKGNFMAEVDTVRLANIKQIKEHMKKFPVHTADLEQNYLSMVTEWRAGLEKLMAVF